MKRPAYDRAVPDGGGPEQMATRQAVTSATGGPFTLDEAAGVVSHHVEVSLMPNWVGGTQVRYGRLEDGALVLRAEFTSRGGASTTHVLTWRRAPLNN